MCMIFMQAEGIPVSPYSVRKALENTSVPIGDLPEDKLSTGQGLMQVDKLDNFPTHYIHENSVNDNFVRFVFVLTYIIHSMTGLLNIYRSVKIFHVFDIR